MTTWSLSPQYKKSAVEKMFFFKDGKVITIEQGFRWATFKAESDERPLSDEELKNEDGYELASFSDDGSWEMWEMVDGCWLEIEAHSGDISEEEQQAFEDAWEEDSYEGVEALGWSQDECEYYYYGPLELTNEDTGEVFQGEPDENISVSGVPLAPEVPNSLSFEDKLEILQELEAEKSLLTDWYPASTNPYRVGTYQVLDTEFEEAWPFPSNVKAAVWDGTKWDNNNVVKWRGLNKEVK